MQNFYFTHQAIGQGLPVLTKNGAMAKQRLMDYISKLLLERDYAPIASPHIGNLELFEKSGHYPYYQDSMFPLIQKLVENGKEFHQDYERWALKPMNCPFHIMAYENLGVVSYRELPVKFYEFGQVYRYEDSGALNGLFRVRSFTQDDGHLFCSEEQISSVVGECLELVNRVCADFGLTLKVKVSVRDKDNKDKYIGKDESWNYAELTLMAICMDVFKKYDVDYSGAAFYGPKIDFIAHDKLNREWQLGTVQLDFNLPERFDLGYVNNKGERARPVLIHRALLGSLERFLGILLENELLHPYLNPFNMGIIWIGEDVAYVDVLVAKLKWLGVYPTIVKKPNHINEAMTQLYAKGLTNIAVIGKREERENTVTLNKVTHSLEAFLNHINRSFSL